MMEYMVDITSIVANVCTFEQDYPVCPIPLQSFGGGGPSDVPERMVPGAACDDGKTTCHHRLGGDGGGGYRAGLGAFRTIVIHRPIHRSQAVRKNGFTFLREMHESTRVLWAANGGKIGVKTALKVRFSL